MSNLIDFAARRVQKLMRAHGASALLSPTTSTVQVDETALARQRELTRQAIVLLEREVRKMLIANGWSL